MAQRLIVDHRLDIKYQNKIIKRLERAADGNTLFGAMKQEDQIIDLIMLIKEEEISQNKLSFADLIYLANTLLPAVSYRPKWLFIDEFQDSDYRLYDFMKSLTGDETHLFAVGDPNQIIYSWRGSDINVFTRFSRDYSATVLSLPVNYRSCKTILEAAKVFIGRNAELYGVRDAGASIVVKSHYNAFNEAQYLAGRISEYVEKGGSYNDCAILYRYQKSAQTLAEVFEQMDIPYTLSVRKTIMDIPALNWFVRLLKYSVNMRDTDSAIFALTDKKYGPGFSRKVARTAITGDLTSKEALVEKAKMLSIAVKGIRSAQELYEYFDLDRYIMPTSISYMDDKQYIIKLLSSIDEYRSSASRDMFSAISEFISSSALYGLDFLSSDMPSDEDTVNLMTLHAAKGLEFKHVYIIGLNRGAFPMIRARSKDDEEEKRLFFVGITRAKDTLEISYYTNPEPGAFPEPSPFLEMLPRRLVNWEEIEPSIEDEDALQKMRKMVCMYHGEGQQTMLFPDQAESHESEDHKQKSAKHPHYGEGIVIDEDENIVVVHFDGFGDKQFMKMFGEVEIIE